MSGKEPAALDYGQVEQFLIDKCGLLPYERCEEELVNLLRVELGLSGDPVPDEPPAHGHWCPRDDPNVAPLVLVRDATGWRHVLDDRPVPIGADLELHAACEGEPGCDWVPVRYEADLTGEAQDVRAYLVVEVAGHQARIVAHSFMRLRWPVPGYPRAAPSCTERLSCLRALRSAP